jgi:hypothetical protein
MVETSTDKIQINIHFLNVESKTSHSFGTSNFSPFFQLSNLLFHKYYNSYAIIQKYRVRPKNAASHISVIYGSI